MAIEETHLKEFLALYAKAEAQSSYVEYYTWGQSRYKDDWTEIDERLTGMSEEKYREIQLNDPEQQDVMDEYVDEITTTFNGFSDVEFFKFEVSDLYSKLLQEISSNTLSLRDSHQKQLYLLSVVKSLENQRIAYRKTSSTALNYARTPEFNTRLKGKADPILSFYTKVLKMYLELAISHLNAQLEVMAYDTDKFFLMTKEYHPGLHVATKDDLMSPNFISFFKRLRESSYRNSDDETVTINFLEDHVTLAEFRCAFNPESTKIKRIFWGGTKEQLNCLIKFLQYKKVGFAKEYGIIWRAACDTFCERKSDYEERDLAKSGMKQSKNNDIIKALLRNISDLLPGKGDRPMPDKNNNIR